MTLAPGFVRAGKVRTSTTSATTGSSWSPPTGSRRSTSSSRPPIPDKGRVLTGLSRFWFAETADLVPNHLLGTDPADAAAGLRRRPRASSGAAR